MPAKAPNLRQVRASTEAYVDGWWTALFDIDRAALWRRITVGPHAELGTYEGYFVAWRGNGVHISLPATCPPEIPRTLAGLGIASLQSENFWQSFAADLGRSVIGPAHHAYLDDDPGSGPDIAPLGVAEVASLRSRVDPAEWEESSFADGAELNFGLQEDGVLVAAANLTDFGGSPRDIGVLVAATARGHGLAGRVGAAAASYAITEYGLARWCARTSNHASLASARRLGFVPHCTQLAIR